MWAVRGIGREEKLAGRAAGGVPLSEFRVPTVGLLAGLHGVGSPLALSVRGDGSRVHIEVGVWTARPGARDGDLDGRAQVLTSVLASCYPVVRLEAREPGDQKFPRADVVLGVPTVVPPTPHDGAVGWDRVLRSLSSQNYQAVVVAQPLGDDALGRLRDEVIQEMRWVRAAAHAENLPSPLSEYYLDVLKRHLATLTLAAGIGAWRTGVYLCGDEQSHPRLRSVWRTTFSGQQSVPEPIRSYEVTGAAEWAAAWSLPDLAGARGPTELSRPFELQTVLTSDQLSAYIHLPEQEVPGYAVDAVARFDSVALATPPGGRVVRLGRLVHAGAAVEDTLEVPLNSLTRHVLVCGVTGSGKSTTVRHLLSELASIGIPFLVLEPAKAEYRCLANLPGLKEPVQVVTVSEELVNPLRVNPLAPAAGGSVALHLDLLKSLFSASFGLWAPLPQVLESCLHRLYERYGWDLSRQYERSAVW